MRAYDNVGNVKKAWITFRGALTVALYTALGVSVAVWSGTQTEHTLYNKYLIRSESLFLSSADPEKVLRFYTSVLDFTPLKSKNNSDAPFRGFRLKDGTELLIFRVPNPEDIQKQSPLLIRVRNGLVKLHAAILKNSGKDALILPEGSYGQELALGQVSEVQGHVWGIEFFVKDLEGNRIIFYMPKRANQKRY